MKVYAPRGLYNATLERVLVEGEEIEVDDQLGAQLAAQGWSTKSKPKRAAAAKRAVVQPLGEKE